MNVWFIFSPDLFPAHLAIVFLFGSLIGSFLNVCIYRLPLGQSVNRPRRSFCPSCGATIAWYDNIPLLSYVILGGICRHCGGRISGRYWLVELLTALLFAGVFWVHRYTPATLLFFVLTAVLIVSTFTDLDHWIIPDSVSVGGMCLGIAGALAVSALEAWGRAVDPGLSLYISAPFDRMGPWGAAANALAGAAFGFALLWAIGVLGSVLFRKEAMGMGDMKLFACIGAFTGWQGCLVVLVVASFVGATVGLSLLSAQYLVARTRDLLARRKLQNAPEDNAGDSIAGDRPRGHAGHGSRRRRLHHLPFGPYIALAAYLVVLFYRPMIDWAMRNLLIFYGGLDL